MNEFNVNYATIIKNNKANEKSPLKVRLNNDQMTYYNRTNNILWQSSSPISKIDTLDIDHYYSNDFYAFSKADDCNSNDCTSTHYERPITEKLSFKADELSLEIRTNDTVHLEEKWIGYKVFIANNSKRTHQFSTFDYRLELTMQALNETGEWQDIQKLIGEGCTSGGSASLIPQRYWQLQMPLFKGSFETRMRLKLEVFKKGGNRFFQIYSNEIKASINPAQFWKRKNYTLRTLSEIDEDDVGIN